jgi:hypothetical protein
MTLDAPPLSEDAPPRSDPEKFALTEYNSISHTFSSGLNAMGLLLPLFFILYFYRRSSELCWKPF